MQANTRIRPRKPTFLHWAVSCSSARHNGMASDVNVRNQSNAVFDWTSRHFTYIEYAPIGRQLVPTSLVAMQMSWDVRHCELLA